MSGIGMYLKLHCELHLEMDDDFIKIYQPTEEDIANALLMSINTNQDIYECIKDIVLCRQDKIKN
jgi:hypothetical protein